MQRVLMAWIGRNDLDARNASSRWLGPIAQVLETRPFDRAVLLCNYPEAEAKAYVKWLDGRTKADVQLVVEKLSSPTSFSEIYGAAVRNCKAARGTKPENVELSFHLSPGTGAMQAVWIMLGKTQFPAKLIESSREAGVQDAVVPFAIAAEYIPELLKSSDESLRERSAAEAPSAPEFDQIVHRSPEMKRLVQRARRVAVRNVPVLIEGESGTGKELIAAAIHKASPRSGSFVAVNCGAIPENLIESELFGHAKGAFTGADKPRSGRFQEADGGTLFLDEIGELPLAAQVKLLRVLQEGEATPLGSDKPRRLDVRIIAATHRSLPDEVIAGRFREDLFYRLAVAVLKVPPLRDRSGDIGLLIDYLLSEVNRAAAGSEPGYQSKKLSAGARSLLLRHPWPGNVRELSNTLQRAAIWSDRQIISTEDAAEAILPSMRDTRTSIVDRTLGEGFDLRVVLNEVAHAYLARAMKEANGNKARATKLLGLPSYQLLTQWLKRHGLEG